MNPISIWFILSPLAKRFSLDHLNTGLTTPGIINHDLFFSDKNLAFQRPVTLSEVIKGKPIFVTDGYKGSMCWEIATTGVHSVITKNEIWLRVDLGAMKQIKFIDIYDRIMGPPYHQRLAYTDIIVYG